MRKMHERAAWIWATAMMVGATLTVKAVDSYWTNTAGGAWSDNLNWNPNSVPGILSGDRVFLYKNNAYTVTLAGNTKFGVIRDTAGTTAGAPTLDLNGYLLTDQTNSAYNLAFGYFASATSDVTITSSQPGGVLNVARLRMADAPGSITKVTMTGSNLVINVTLTSDSYWGYSADGKFAVENGATLNQAGYWHMGLGVTGVTPSLQTTFTVSGPGSSVNANYNSSNSGNLGKYGSGLPLLLITNGGAFYSSNGSLMVAQGGDGVASASTNANGKILITGSGSLYSGKGLNLTRYAGNAVLTKNGYTGTAGAFAVVENQGQMSLGANGLAMADAAYVGVYTNAFAYGQVTVQGSGSLVTNAARTWIGAGAQGALYVLDGGAYRTAAGQEFVLGRSTGNDTVWTNAGAYGLLVVSNAGSVAELGTLKVGGARTDGTQDGYGDVLVMDNGYLVAKDAAGITLRSRSGLTVSDALVEASTLVLNTSTTVRIELGARDHANAYVQLTGDLNLAADAKLELGLLDNFSATVGEEIQLITMGNWAGTGYFANRTDGETVNLGAYTLKYQEYDEAITLYVTAIPEPGTLGLIGAGLGIAAFLRRQNRRG